MAGKAVDVEQGMARDFSQIFYGETDEPVQAIIEISLEDDDELRLSWDGPKGENFSLFVPADRIRQLLKKA